MAKPAMTMRPKRQDEVRAKIQTGNLIARLRKYAEGEITLEAGQIKAIEILLKKSLPDLSAVEMSGPDKGPIEMDMTLSPHEAYMKLLGK